VDDGEDLRNHQARRGALEEPGGDEHLWVRREAAQRRGEREATHADDEDPLAPVDVAEPAAGDQDGGEREHVARHDPLDLCVLRPEVRLNAGDRDVHDRRVQQVHEAGNQDDGQGEPAAAVETGLGVDGRLPSRSAVCPSPRTGGPTGAARHRCDISHDRDLLLV
jgi:hypothetical protein